MLRQPAAANRFYPGSPRAIDEVILGFLDKNELPKQEAKAIVCPHAGYIYSGELACKTIASTLIPETVIILGPNHHGMGDAVSLSTLDWDMPQGQVSMDRSFSQALLNASNLITEDDQAHRFEHSLEVQIPILQTFQQNLKLVPLVVSQISYRTCEEIGAAIAQTIKMTGTTPLILASTDMSHYESRESASAKDKLALDMIEALDPAGLYQTVTANRISMCGYIPVTIALVTAKLLGATQAKMTGYTDSGYTSGDTAQVVGYAGFIIS